jgi:Cu+-exporting ATPase
LSSCNLDNYYTYAENPGIKQLKAPARDAFAYLDEEGIQEKLLSFRSASLAKVNFRLPAMHCASCIWLVENFHKLVPGVVSARVNFTRRSAAFDYNPQVLTLRRLVEQLAAIGYEPELKLDATSKPKSNPYTRRLILQMGVAGFCFGNIMLLSFPDYLSSQGAPDAAYRSFFGIVNFALGLPVLLFSAADYLRSGWQAVRQRQINMDVPISLGILALFIRSTYEIFVLGGGGYMDSLAALIFFLLIGKWIQQRTYDSLSFERDYKSYFPIAVHRITPDGEVPCGIETLRPGDHYRVRSGELIPADSVMVEGTGALDYSFVSGESEPVSAMPGAKVFAGGRQMGQSIVLETLKTVDQSYLTGLWNSSGGARQEHRLEAFADRVGRRFTYVILLISLATAAYWLVVDAPVALNAVSAVLIVACPCALALSFPFAFANAVRLLGRHGLYLKNASALGRMAEVTDIVFDKTGTLTHSEDARTSYIGRSLNSFELNAVYSMVSQSGHPLSRFISRKLSQSSSIIPVDWFQEQQGKGIEAFIDGSEYLIGSASFAGAPTAAPNPLASEIHLSIDGEHCGRFEINKSYRNGLDSIIKHLRRRHKLYLLSGDNDSERRNIEQLFGQKDDIHFNQSPFDKERFVAGLRKEGAVIAMVGDGLNDAGALRVSDVGISLADDVFRFVPASDAILSSNYFELLPRFFDFSRGTLRVVQLSFVLSFLYNAVGVFFAVRGMLEPVIAAVLMPLSSITVVSFVTLGTAFLHRKYLLKN